VSTVGVADAASPKEEVTINSILSPDGQALSDEDDAQPAMHPDRAKAAPSPEQAEDIRLEA